VISSVQGVQQENVVLGIRMGFSTSTVDLRKCQAGRSFSASEL